VNKPAPDFTLVGMDDKKVALKDLKGQVFVVDFWATWCGPCRMSLPLLDKVYQDKKAAGLKVYAVDLKEDKDAVQAFITKDQALDPRAARAGRKMAEAYGVTGIPQTVLVGKDGW